MKKKIFAVIAGLLLVTILVFTWTEGLNYLHVGEMGEQSEIGEDNSQGLLVEKDTTAYGQDLSSETASREESSQEKERENQTTDFAPGYYGKLQIKEGKLCGQDGNFVQLKGISSHGLAWYPDYVNADALSYMHENWGINVFRLAMYTTNSGGYCSTDEDGQKKLLELIDVGVEAATANDMYAIIDWHILEDGNPLTYIGRAKDFFELESKKYQDNDHVIYEICNEPNGGTTWSQIKDYAEAIIPVIRANDKDAIIIVGTPNWSQDVDEAAKDPITIDDNVMYALHFYAGTHKENLRQKASKAIGAGLPLFVTEFSICDASGNGGNDAVEADKWIAFLDQNGISYVEWNLSNKNESSALISSACQKKTDWTEDDLSESGLWMLEHIRAY